MKSAEYCVLNLPQGAIRTMILLFSWFCFTFPCPSLWRAPCPDYPQASKAAAATKVQTVPSYIHTHSHTHVQKSTYVLYIYIYIHTWYYPLTGLIYFPTRLFSTPCLPLTNSASLSPRAPSRLPRSQSMANMGAFAHAELSKILQGQKAKFLSSEAKPMANSVTHVQAARFQVGRL